MKIIGKVFNEEKKTGILGISTVLEEVDGAPLPDPFRIVADKQGIRFFGESKHYASLEDLQVLAQTIDKAWRLHLAYRPKITNERGH